MHFDVAPSYGYGEAESWLGKELSGRRDEVILATKFGIVASPLARWLRPLKPVVRFLRASRQKPMPPIPLTAEKEFRTDRFHHRIKMTGEGLRISVEKSLRRLRTDRIDWLFLHEPLSPVAPFSPVLEMAKELKRQGKIRAWGLAYPYSTEAIHADYLHHFDALQFNLSPASPDYEVVKAKRARSANILFSPLRGANPKMNKQEVLKRLSEDFPQSVILCSMFTPEHIRANARALC